MRRMLKGITVSALAVMLWVVMGFSPHPDDLPAGNAGQDGKLLVIVNSEVNLESISVAELNRIYLGKKKILAGQNINRLASLENGEVHQLFLSTCMNRSHSSFINYWKRMVFTGKSLPPKSFKTINKLREFLTQNPNAITFIDTKDLTDDLKAVLIIE
mgnify:CR=1 FL=1